jgi:hypothetical protein
MRCPRWSGSSRGRAQSISPVCTGKGSATSSGSTSGPEGISSTRSAEMEQAIRAYIRNQEGGSEVRSTQPLEMTAFRRSESLGPRQRPHLPPWAVPVLSPRLCRGILTPAGPECKKGHTNPQARLRTYGPAGPSELVKGQHTQQYASVDAAEHADAQREREGPHRVSSIRCRCHRVYRSLATGSRMVAVPDRPSSRSQ